ncbi:MAG: glucosamine-6-phosphate deaminase [Thermoguttaceae bacterium]|nr:glucosamine-6-phosphate deaminase [Thermoguttaceae bacterium]MBQ4080557.1 glucosamine-6-phosphate deaminase [Thermoguttaceae bacterium]MBQ5368076.1 glucosamine-6-phosphate deaminase [Thermoguttaceae bacterium]
MAKSSSTLRAALPARNVEAPTFVFESASDACKHVAQQIAGLIRERNALSQSTKLGLVAGSSPIGVYQELVRIHQENGLDFSRVSIFMVNEYYGVDPDRLQSLRRWLLENFIKKTNLRMENVHFFDANVKSDELETYCRNYEREIANDNGVDILLLGVASNGAVGFNEPYTSIKSRTRLAALDYQTRRDAASLFFSEANVPTHGLTIGIGTMLEAHKIVVLAFGDGKASVIQQALEEPISEETPAGWLRVHPDVSFILDKNAAAQLKDVATPWRVRQVQWDDEMIKRAVLWLCEQSGKSLLKLTDSDFRAYGLHSLLRSVGSAPEISERVFNAMLATIAQHPCGTTPKRILAFSPHPDDDVISMGGTMIRLVDDKHELHMAYMTSGNIAVNDYDAYRIADLLSQINKEICNNPTEASFIEENLTKPLSQKKPGELDVKNVLDVKRLIRWSEARAADRACGIPEDRVHFLNLPFYATGAVEKLPPTDVDRKLVRDLIDSLNPEVIFVAGDLSDPHGTHRVCAMVVFSVLLQMKEEGKKLPEILLYRGAWQEWPLDKIEIAVPLSPRDSEKKREAIFRHASQKDGALFLGGDAREFWQRAEDRNFATAAAYNRIGLPEYYAVEAFVHWDGTFDF